MKPPIMSNDKFASQKYEAPLATMPRIYNPEAMSNERGPAAEGVAHKISSGWVSGNDAPVSLKQFVFFLYSRVSLAHVLFFALFGEPGRNERINTSFSFCLF